MDTDKYSAVSSSAPLTGIFSNTAAAHGARPFAAITNEIDLEIAVDNKPSDGIITSAYADAGARKYMTSPREKAKL